MTLLLLKLAGLLGVLAAAYLWSRRQSDRRVPVGALGPSAEVPAAVILRGVRG